MDDITVVVGQVVACADDNEESAVQLYRPLGFESKI